MVWATTNNRLETLEEKCHEVDTVKAQMYEIQTSLAQIQTDIQWIWAVLSGFEKDIPLEKVLEYPYPEADGYPGFWHNPISMQHPLATIEIVPWDSGLTLFFSKEKELVDKFRAGYPQSEDLSVYNERWEK